MPEFIQVITTAPTKEDAQKIADLVVKRRLAACVQVDGPITSTFWWKSQVETSEESRCLIKSRTDLYPELEAAIREVHPYEIPEILAVPVIQGGRAYLDWMSSELKKPGDFRG